MKKLENKKVEILKENSEKSTYKNLIEYCVNVPPQGGFSMEDFRQRDRIDKALSNIKGNTIEFEDADVINLKKIVSSVKWQIRHKDILMFLTDIENL